MSIFKSKPVIAAVGLCLLVAGGASGALLFQKINGFRDGRSEAVKVVKKAKAFSYVELTKIMVSLPISAGPDGSASSIYRVCSIDMAFEIGDKDHEKFRNLMPLVRSFAVQALSVHTYAEVRKVPLEQLQEDVGTRILSIAASRHMDRPFNAAVITQLLCE